MSDTTFPDDVVFECASNAGNCAETCIGLQECNACPCATVDLDAGGPWGNVMDVLFGLLPVLFLIGVTIKSTNPWPTTQSLPTAAGMLFWMRLAYFGSDVRLTCASVVLGLHEAMTPLSIMAGAMLLFESMESSYCLPWQMREMKALTAGHPVAELALLYGFATLVEGASGFGTPVALGAPMLVSTGHDPEKAVVVMLILNTFATVWGAVGTPIWFGFGDVELPNPDEDFVTISTKAAVALTICAIVLMPFVLNVLVPRKLILQNIVFVILSTLCVTGPSLGLAMVSYEFPSLLGGMVGMAGTGLLIYFQVGLHPLELHDGEDDNGKEQDDEEEIDKSHSLPPPPANGAAATATNGNATSTFSKGHSFDLGRDPLEIGSVSEHSLVRKYSTSHSNLSERSQDASPPPLGTEQAALSEGDGVEDENGNVQTVRELVENHLGPRKSLSEGYLQELVQRTFPIWGVVLLLILTRVEAFGIKQVLTDPNPALEIHFGTYGTFRLSASLVFQLRDILTYPNLNWKYEFLYVPFFMPFGVCSALTLLRYRNDLACSPSQIVTTVARRLAHPAVALLGALVLVQLLIRIDTAAPAFVVGNVLADWFQQAFVVICPLLGALGSFFSGSTTVSNLTFADIQFIAAESIGTSVTTMLALQAVGASAGNGICLNNIIAATAVVGLTGVVGEGRILLQTYKFVFASTTLATVIMLVLFFRF